MFGGRRASLPKRRERGLKFQSREKGKTMPRVVQAQALAGFHETLSIPRGIVIPRVLPGADFAVRSGGDLGLRHMRGDRIHQRRRQAIVGLKTQFLQPSANGFHLLRFDAGLDHRGNERRKSRGR
jgi:hypothetical protein